MKQTDHKNKHWCWHSWNFNKSELNTDSCFKKRTRALQIWMLQTGATTSKKQNLQTLVVNRVYAGIKKSRVADDTTLSPCPEIKMLRFRKNHKVQRKPLLSAVEVNSVLCRMVSACRSVLPRSSTLYRALPEDPFGNALTWGHSLME